MTKKGSEVDLRGFRIQVDPLVVLTRVALRQKLLVGIFVVLGTIATAVAYKKTPKKYESSTRILVRAESFEEQTLTRIVNTGIGSFGSNPELMLVINELDLFPTITRTKPIDLAIVQIKKDLKVKVLPKEISLAYRSDDADMAAKVVAFCTERLLYLLSRLTDAPYLNELNALDTAIADLQPRKKAAEDALFQFKNAHPEIPPTFEEFGSASAAGDGTASVNAEIRAAESALADARSGKVTKKSITLNTPVQQAYQSAKAAYETISQRLTETHPEVIAAKARLAEAEAAANKEVAAAEAEANAAAGSAEEAQKARVAAAEARLNELLAKKVQKAAAAVKKPELQREYAELMLNASTLTAEYRTLSEGRNKLLRDRLSAANKFQEDFQLIDPARVSEIPVEPDKKKFMAIGVVVALIFGLVVASMREMVRQAYVDPGEFEEQSGLQVFAVLPGVKTGQ